MNAEKRDLIYNRLLNLKIKIDVSGVPNPRYLNEKLGECRVYLDEIERYSIETFQALSAIQQALNTAQADFETKTEDLLSNNEEIKSLPNIRDREARVNNLLRSESSTIRNYENELQALNYLLKAITLKNKNLMNDNSDIKAHIKIMESQIKLGAGSIADPAVRSLLEEFKKSNINKDAFEGAVSEVIEEEVIDPSEPLNIDNLLKQGMDGENLPIINNQEENIPESLIDPDPKIDPENHGEPPTMTSLQNIEDIKSEEILNEPIEDTKSEEILNEPIEGLNIEVQETDEINDEESIINLDEEIDFTQTTGGQSQKKVKAEKIVSDTKVQKREVKIAESSITPETAISKKTAPSLGIDLDSLLDELNIS